jgi:hypothetical protein
MYYQDFCISYLKILSHISDYVANKNGFWITWVDLLDLHQA